MQPSILHDGGIEAVRLANRMGKYRPHIGISFDGHLFAVDTTRAARNDPIQPEVFLITHAHSDHNGKSAMLSPKAVCSEETALALEIRFGREYKGSTFRIGESFEVNGVEINTHPTHHTIGSTAFSWETSNGEKILVTGDVKDASHLPACDYLVTEANYGDPADPSCYFEDDIAGLEQLLGDNVAFGAYSFGKAQRAVSLIRNAGWWDAISMESMSYRLTEVLMHDCGDLNEMQEYGSVSGGIAIVPPWDLGKLPGSWKKYVLTGRRDYYYSAIHISDHMDVTGLLNMVQKLQPEATLIYHPDGHRPRRLAEHLNKLGYRAAALDQL